MIIGNVPNHDDPDAECPECAYWDDVCPECGRDVGTFQHLPTNGNITPMLFFYVERSDLTPEQMAELANLPCDDSLERVQANCRRLGVVARAAREDGTPAGTVDAAGIPRLMSKRAAS